MLHNLDGIVDLLVIFQPISIVRFHISRIGEHIISHNVPKGSQIAVSYLHKIYTQGCWLVIYCNE